MVKNFKNLIIYNPNAGRGQHELLLAVLNELEKKDAQYTVLVTEYAGHAMTIAKENHNSYDVIVAAGGDGTINEVINGLRGSNATLAIIPVGTSNVVAKEILLPHDPEIIADVITEGKIKKYYLPKINGRYFSLMASVGYDSTAVKCVNRKLKKKIAEGAYFFSFMKALFATDNIKYELSVDENKHHAYGAIISNGKYYGGNFISAPDASIFDPGLYVVMLKKKGRIAAMKYFLSIIFKRINKNKDVGIIEATNINIKATGQANIQIDGDHFGYLPAQISIGKENIKIKTPNLF